MSQKYIKQSYQAEEESSDWMVSYADMMTLLLVFFVSMYSISDLDQEKFNSFTTELTKTFRGQTQKQQPVEPKIEQQKVVAFDMLKEFLFPDVSQQQLIEKLQLVATSYEKAEKAYKIQNLFPNKNMIANLFLNEVQVLIPDKKLFAKASSIPTGSGLEILRSFSKNLKLIQNVETIKIGCLLSDSQKLSVAVCTKKLISIYNFLVSVGISSKLISLSYDHPESLTEFMNKTKRKSQSHDRFFSIQVIYSTISNSAEG